jgi:hypothetical protein
MVNVDVRAAKLVALSADSVSGFFFDTSEGVVFGSFTATREGVDVVMGTPPATVEALLAADRDANGSYAWLADGARARLSKWQLVDGSLVEVRAVADPADPSDNAHEMAARGEHGWRVWAKNGLEFDSEFTILAAYLAPNATEFAPAEDLGSGDDYVGPFSTHGVSLSGEVAVDACGAHDGLLERAFESCVSAAASPDGVVESNEGEIDEARTFYAGFDTGIATLDCGDHVLSLRLPDSDEAEPLLAPCGNMLLPHRLDPAGVPSFAYATVRGRYVLSKY